MTAKNITKTVKYLKDNNGSWTYRRRVPERHHKTLGIKMWNRPCGDVSYQEAVFMVTNWTVDDDALIAELDDPTVGELVRLATETALWAPYVDRMIDGAKILKENPQAMSYILDEEGNEHLLDLEPYDSLQDAKDAIKRIDADPALDDTVRLVRYQNVLKVSFGAHVDQLTDLDDREYSEMVKRKLERRIADLAGDPNTITSVAERYYDAHQIGKGVRRKYRGNIKKLTNFLGNVPVSHVTAVSLRRFRDHQSATMIASSLAAVFTPIRGMFRYAINEELIELNPMPSVMLKKDKRSVHERKCIPYPPLEMKRLLNAMDEHWGSPKRGLRTERRVAIHMVCRVMAYSCLRPIEVVRLEPEDVSDAWIKVRNSKTASSHRTVPLHPTLIDFPKFVAEGGLNTFRALKTDQVEPVRYNFRRLTRDMMDPPIAEKKKVLYSLRSTFSNAMRRAGADPDVRRAILGHAEGGALNHYDDGPEFFKKRKWINATDPTVIYPDTDDYFDDGLGDDE